jgi:hypothetical protein
VWFGQKDQPDSRRQGHEGRLEEQEFEATTVLLPLSRKIVSIGSNQKDCGQEIQNYRKCLPLGRKKCFDWIKPSESAREWYS